MRSDRRTAGIAALCLLAAVLPFELKEPLFRFGPIAITDVELVLYFALFAWCTGRLASGARGLEWTPAHTAVAAWGAALVVSAAFAPSGRAASVKFALRSLAGCALFFATADLVRSPARAARVLLGVVAGAVASALTAFGEVALPDVADLLLAFKTQPTLVGTFLRAGGSFQYANTAAMYWEAALPIAVGLGGSRALGSAAGAWRIAGALSAAILAEAILLSSSRGALIVTAALLAGLVYAGFRHVRALGGSALVGLASLGALAILTMAMNPWLALRFRSETTARWYRASYDAGSGLDLAAGETATVRVAVRNDGLLPWRATGPESIRLSYHWRDPALGRAVVFEGLRTALPADVAPSERVTVLAAVLAPPAPGLYTLQWYMLHEGSLWFSEQGDPADGVPARVRPATGGAANALAPDVSEPALAARPARAELWRAGLRLWTEHPILGAGPDNFRHRYGSVLGLTHFDDRIHSNSLYVETLATTGIAGGLALIALMAALGRAVRLAWLAAGDPPARALVAGLAAGLAAFFLHGLVDCFFEFTPTYGLFWLLAGITAGLGSGVERAR